MAIRQIRTIGDEILRKQCKPVKEMTPRTAELIEDMFETMYEANGVGLAAPQVGILRQLVVIDVDDGNQYVLINPEILETEGSQTGSEGCLSVPGKSGTCLLYTSCIHKGAAVIASGGAGIQRSRDTEKRFLSQRPGCAFQAKLPAVFFRLA